MQRIGFKSFCALAAVSCLVAGCGPAEPPEAEMFRAMEAREVVVTDGKLVELNFGSKSFSDADCAKLATLTDLQMLDLGKCQVTDAGLDHVGKLSSLESLSLEGAAAVTDEGIAKLSGLSKLTNLNVGQTKVTDKGLETIGKLSALQKLSLAPAPGVTDAGMSQLDGLKQLNEIWLVGTGVTVEGVKTLKAAHPNLLVHGVDDDDEEEETETAAEPSADTKATDVSAPQP